MPGVSRKMNKPPIGLQQAWLQSGHLALEIFVSKSEYSARSYCVLFLAEAVHHLTLFTLFMKRNLTLSK